MLTTGKELIPLAYDIYKPDFMVFSTLQNMIPGRSMTEQKDMASVMATIIELARKCCPAVLVTHSPQDDKKRRAAGSVTISANFVVEGHYKASDAEGKAVHVQLRSKAGSGMSDFSLELETEGAGNDPSAVRRIVYTGKGETQSRSEHASLILAATLDIGVEETMAKSTVFVSPPLTGLSATQSGFGGKNEVENLVEIPLPGGKVTNFQWNSSVFECGKKLAYPFESAKDTRFHCVWST